MKWLSKLIAKLNFLIKRETWWRKYYNRVEITPTVVARNGRCPYCDAADAPLHSGRECNFMENRDCPCKSNQILIKK